MDNRLKEIRKQKKITQEKLAELTGLSRPYISDIERKKSKPSGETILKIAKALNMPAEQIFFINAVNRGLHISNTATPQHEGREAG